MGTKLCVMVFVQTKFCSSIENFKFFLMLLLREFLLK